MPVPNSGGYRNPSMMSGPPLFGLARSPPGPNKSMCFISESVLNVLISRPDTKHVPCKFFRQGACQAGAACPFSHSMDPQTHQAPCKYFSKGNCKFGAKCALAHYLPDGRKVNRNAIDSGAMMSNPYDGYSKPNHMPYGPADTPMMPPVGPQQYGGDYYGPGEFFGPEEHDAYPSDRFQRPYQPGPNFDSAVNSPPTSHFGSPPNGSSFAKSPMDNVRTALNVPMPKSFDPNEPSRKYGVLGQSAPVKGPALFSPPTATTSFARRLGSPPETTMNRAFGSLAGNTTSSPLGASPQTQDDSIDRVMQSTRNSSQPLGIVSTSVPRRPMPTREHPHSDLDDGTDIGHDLLPGSLHDEVLTPAEQMRRLSRADQESIPGMAIPSGHSSKVGSPPTGSSPSRFSHIWAEQRDKPAGIGNVGSPLKESWMPGSSNAPRGSQISGISQAMARMELNRPESVESDPSRAPQAGMRATSNPLYRLDRTISSPGLPPRRLDEEGEGVFFPMDDDKRSGSIWGASPRLAPVRERPNGESMRSRQDDVGPGAGLSNGLYGFRS